MDTNENRFETEMARFEAQTKDSSRFRAVNVDTDALDRWARTGNATKQDDTD